MRLILSDELEFSGPERTIVEIRGATLAAGGGLGYGDHEGHSFGSGTSTSYGVGDAGAGAHGGDSVREQRHTRRNWATAIARRGVGVGVLLVAAELSVPLVAERNGLTPWHPHHITERYGCFTLIVLGESLLASANAVIGALHDEATLGPLIWIAILALVVTASLWWLYFWPPHHRAITSLRRSLR